MTFLVVVLNIKLTPLNHSTRTLLRTMILALGGAPTIYRLTLGPKNCVLALGVHLRPCLQCYACG